MPTLEGPITRTCTVFVRHASGCSDRAKGPQWHRCDCRKWLLIYDGTTRKQRKVSAKTRSWEKAEEAARLWLDQYDPTKVELRALRAEKEMHTVTIEKAVFSYLQDMITRLGDNGTVSRTRTLLGDVNEAGNVKRDGKLFDWLGKQVPRPVLISELTTPHLTAWRSSWTYESDLTAAISFDGVKTFFKFCMAQGWLKSDPAAGIKRSKIARGNRTATFSDEQYDAILAKSKGNQRLETFLELLRWSGMALVDAVEFDHKLVDSDGTLRYTRKKTGTLATVQLPEHVIVLLRSVDGGERPFRRTNVTLESCIHEWRRDLQGLFKKAGITKVQTDVGPRPAHPHMLRDTCAVWYLRNGMSLHGVSKVMGHSNPTITARHYLPFVKELETAHIAENKEVLAAAKPKASGNVRAIR
jgi:integrase